MLNNLSETLSTAGPLTAFSLASILHMESFFGNFSFALLFFAMVCYWIDTAFFDATKSPNKQVSSVSKTGFFNYSLPPFAVNFLKLENIATAAMITANISLIILLLLRWQNSGHFPLSNLYESLMFLCWSCTSIYLFILKSTYPLLMLKVRRDNSNQLLETNSKSPRQTFDLFFYKLLGSIASPCALFINAYATFSLPKEMQNAAPLVPALQSNWLMMHVTVMIISYSALMLGSLLAIAFLIVTSNLVVTTGANPLVSTARQDTLTQPKIIGEAPLVSTAGQDTPTTSESESESMVIDVGTYANAVVRQYAKEDRSINLTDAKTMAAVLLASPTQDAMQILAKNLDNLSYRILGIGFPFLTIGILSGAVWANEAWGSYWSWDPKETWALLTWLVFAIYLHMRLSHGWQGKKPAIMASVGFLTVWFCFLGVNLLGEGLHSYGWVLN